MPYCKNMQINYYNYLIFNKKTIVCLIYFTNPRKNCRQNFAVPMKWLIFAFSLELLEFS